MAIENELKYVLDGSSKELYHTFTNLPGAEVYEFQQGYLDGYNRLRRSKHKRTSVSECFFTYKNTVKGQLIEIETAITDDDFEKLWTQVGRTLTKDRVKVPTSDYIWEIDFFKHKGECYFVMAEVEMPPDQVEPSVVPDFITNNLLYAVPRGDSRFLSKSLTKPDAVQALLKGLRNGKHQSA